MTFNVLRLILSEPPIPVEMQPYVIGLCKLGVDFHKLRKLVAPSRRGRPRNRVPKRVAAHRGAPNRSPMTMELLDETVRTHREDNEDNTSAKSDIEVIRCLLSDYQRDCPKMYKAALAASQSPRGGTNMTLERFAKSLQQRLSRWRKAQRDLLHK